MASLRVSGDGRAAQNLMGPYAAHFRDARQAARHLGIPLTSFRQIAQAEPSLQACIKTDLPFAAEPVTILLQLSPFTARGPIL